VNSETECNVVEDYEPNELIIYSLQNSFNSIFHINKYHFYTYLKEVLFR